VFIAEGKGGHQRLIPVSSRFFDSVAAYLDAERPADTTTEKVFVVLKGARRGSPLTPPDWMKCLPVPGAVRDCATAPATSCGTPA
jgi:site-specific recombinase XerD